MSANMQEQTMDAYRRMAEEARYRPAAPSDGLGNITVPHAELKMSTEAHEYAVGWLRDEDEGTYDIGSPSYQWRPALVFAVEGARVLCGSIDERGLATAAKLLRMAADELDARD